MIWQCWEVLILVSEHFCGFLLKVNQLLNVILYLKVECAAYNPEPYSCEETDPDSLSIEHGFLWVRIFIHDEIFCFGLSSSTIVCREVGWKQYCRMWHFPPQFVCYSLDTSPPPKQLPHSLSKFS